MDVVGVSETTETKAVRKMVEEGGIYDAKPREEETSGKQIEWVEMTLLNILNSCTTDLKLNCFVKKFNGKSKKRNLRRHQ